MAPPVTNLATDTVMALLTATTRLARWCFREHQLPASECVACVARSARHPAGQLRRYTTSRVAGHPTICERHDHLEFDDLFAHNGTLGRPEPDRTAECVECGHTIDPLEACVRLEENGDVTAPLCRECF